MAARRYLHQVLRAGEFCASYQGELEAIFITHARRDHAGAMHAVATKTGAPVWASEADAPAIEGTSHGSRYRKSTDHIVNRLAFVVDGAPSRFATASRRRAGSGFHRDRVSRSHSWSDRPLAGVGPDRDLRRGDAEHEPVTGLPQLGEMPTIFTCDVDEARGSIRKLAALEAGTISLRPRAALTKNAAERINEFAAGLPLHRPTPRSRPRAVALPARA